MNKFTLLLVASLISCNGSEQKEGAESPVNENLVQLTDAQMANAGIVTGTMEHRNISTVLKLTGTVEVPPGNMVSISFPMGGFLKASKLLPGMRVRKGEPIATMEDPQFVQLEQDYLTAKARYIFMEGEYDRQRELNQSKASSDKMFQQIQADYTTQKIMVKALTQKLQLIGIDAASLNEDNISGAVNIHSPIDGYVSEVHINIGKYVNPSDVLFEIVNPADIHLALNVFEKDIHKIKPGQKVVAYTNSNPQKKYRCEIMLIGKGISTDRSVEVHCHFHERDDLLIPGMFMNAEIDVQSSNAWTLPSDAVVSYENKQFVFIAKGNNQFEMLEVRTGNTENGFVEIIMNDLATFQNTTFVSKGAYSLLMKMKNTSDE